MRAYLDRLDAAARALPATERQDLRAWVWLRVAGSAGPTPSEARLVRVLDDLGPPEGLVPASHPGLTSTLRDPAVVHLLGCSLLTAGVTGVLGLLRVWRSASWPAGDAGLATFLVVVCGLPLPLLTTVQPVAGALAGGLGVGAPLAGLVLGAVLLRQRRGYRRDLRVRRTEEPHHP